MRLVPELGVGEELLDVGHGEGALGQHVAGGQGHLQAAAGEHLWPPFSLNRPWGPVSVCPLPLQVFKGGFIKIQTDHLQIT